MPGLLRAGAALGQRRALRVCRRGLDALIAAALAPRCAACADPLDAPLDGPVCPRCWAAADFLLFPVSRPPVPPSAVETAVAAGLYDGALRDIIHAFKYEGRRSLAAPLGRMMAEAGAHVLAEADCVVPVPLHPWRRLRRGFNQAAELAQRLDRPVVHALWRVRATPPQAGLSAGARRRNVGRAFRLSPWMSRARRQGCIRDRAIVVVDDVRTTGATLNACATVLREAGAREVRALTLAFTPAPFARDRSAGRSGSAERRLA